MNKELRDRVNATLPAYCDKEVVDAVTSFVQSEVWQMVDRIRSHHRGIRATTDGSGLLIPITAFDQEESKYWPMTEKDSDKKPIGDLSSPDSSVLLFPNDTKVTIEGDAEIIRQLVDRLVINFHTSSKRKE